MLTDSNMITIVIEFKKSNLFLSLLFYVSLFQYFCFAICDMTVTCFAFYAYKPTFSHEFVKWKINQRHNLTLLGKAIAVQKVY